MASALPTTKTGDTFDALDEPLLNEVMDEYRVGG